MNRTEQLKVTKEMTLKDALKRLDQTALSILLLVDQEDVLQRTITDGDIRRLLLAGGELDDNLEALEPQTPVVAIEGTPRDDLLALLDQYEINQIPIVNTDNKPVGLYLRHELQPQILLSVPHMGDYERQYVDEAFQTNWIAPLGPNVDAFEKELADHVGSQHAVALNSGTAGIHLALRLLNVGPGDLVLCSSFTFVASANPILYQGATPIFIDSEPVTWNMSPLALEKALKDSREKGKMPKAMIIAHLYGQSADMEKIMALSKNYGVPVVEDAAESLGAKYHGKHTGTFGRLGVFSFNGNKIITTSGGGMLVSDDRDLIEKARFLATQARDVAPHYEHSECGYNYRMSNVLAGIGRGQLKVLDSRVEARRGVFERYYNGLSDLSCIQWMPEPDEYYSSRWLSVFRLDSRKTKVTPQDLIKGMSEVNIEARHVWKPMHSQPLFNGCCYYPQSEQSFCSDLFDTGLCLPSASNMTEGQQQNVIGRIRDVIETTDAKKQTQKRRM